MKTAKEIIEETIQYYSEDTSRRALEEGGCQYTTEDGNHCAVGRCLEEEYQTTDFEYNQTKGVIQLVDYYQTMDNILREEYRGHPTDLWERLQRLHDGDFNWDEDGLTGIGIAAANRILEDYKND